MDEDWREAGTADAVMELMPMRTELIPPFARAAYAVGYRAVGRIGLDPNPHTTVERPRRTLRSSAQENNRLYGPNGGTVDP